MNILSTRAHGVIDYLTGALLILAPYLFGFASGGVEQLLPQILGLAILGMSLITRYELSVAKIIPLGVHLAVDFAGGLALALRLRGNRLVATSADRSHGDRGGRSHPAAAPGRGLMGNHG